MPDEFYLCWPNKFSTGKCMSPHHEKPVVTCHHVIKKKQPGSYFVMRAGLRNNEFCLRGLKGVSLAAKSRKWSRKWMSGRFKLLLRLHIIYPFTAHFHSLRSLTFINTYHPYMLHTVNTNEESAKLGKKWLQRGMFSVTEKKS